MSAPGVVEAWVSPAEGLLAHLVGRIRPERAERIRSTGRLETAIIGLGQAGTRHAGLMKEFGTPLVAAVAPGQGGTRVHETIPVYESVKEMLRRHPDVAAVSIWKHYSTAAEAAIEAIEADLPVVVLVSEGVPARDFRGVLAAARSRGTLLLGPNTPGVIFPPERIKAGMLPDVFYPAEPEPGRFTAQGVTIISRSGAILYHLSDALAAAGVAQNAVIGVGGDSVVGSPFHVIVPLVMSYPGTDLVVVAGEIGGCAEEMLAADLKAHPERYGKPLVALLSGRTAPEGKRMGHAGAIVAPGAEYGTYASKRAALAAAGVPVVNSQHALVEAVRQALGGRTYFSPERYYARMKALWEAPPPAATWTTAITRIAPNNIAVRGEPLVGLIGKRSFLETAMLLVAGEFPSKPELARLDRLARAAAAKPVPKVPFSKTDDVSKRLAAMLLADGALAAFGGSEAERAAFCLGRAGAFLARVLGSRVKSAESFSALAAQALAGSAGATPERQRLLEGALVACVDHGVTAPSTQGTRLASSVRATLAVAVASGVSNITDVHGGAGAKAAEFFLDCARAAGAGRTSPTGPTSPTALVEATERVIRARLAAGGRIEGLGHRLHTRDPRRDALWKLAESCRLAGPCVAVSRVAEEAFEAVKGISLPVNVDGVIGAIVADLGLKPAVAKAIFIFGRVAGLLAHHFEEVNTQPPMRRINFEQAVYRGK